MEFSKVFRFLMDVSGNLISAEFGGFSGLKVDTNRNFRLINFSEFPRF